MFNTESDCISMSTMQKQVNILRLILKSQYQYPIGQGNVGIVELRKPLISATNQKRRKGFYLLGGIKVVLWSKEKRSLA